VSLSSELFQNIRWSHWSTYSSGVSK